ncbi:ABC transporter substrate-binding protein [Amycolatopsis sp.]|uniref:ABC transporter substrate-binding protein n=1 Tax=Amycolatopsis sp. TaxID=37632 RepID=UPI002C507849|nr:ABC transporter substrate-binding protein [Amycolatopsis sp.]HVV08350.1 ABC transporter substrate-binding protein [Amycolatopsis sp.]
MRLKRFSALVAALVLTGVLAACGQSGAQSGDGLTLTLGDQANGLQTLLNAAHVLDGTSYHVKWAEFQGAAPLFQAMQGGQVDTGYAADLPTLQAISGKLPIKLVGALQGSGAGTAILVRDDSSVHSVTDLKGKTVVVSSARGSIAEYLLAKVLQDNGLKFSDVTVQYVLPTAAQAAFNSGQTEIWATFDPYHSIGLASGGRVLVDGTQGRVSGVGFVSAAESSLADPAKKSAITDFLQRLARAEAWASANADQYAQVYAKTNGVAPDIAKKVVEHGQTAAGPVTPQIVTTVQGVADLMHGIGALPTDVRVADVTDTSVYH